MFLKLFISLLIFTSIAIWSFLTWNIHASVYPFYYKNDWKEIILSCRGKKCEWVLLPISRPTSLYSFAACRFGATFFFSRMYLGLSWVVDPRRYSALFHHPRVHCPPSFLSSLSKYQPTSSMDRVFASRLHCRLYCISTSPSIPPTGSKKDNGRRSI